MLLKACIFDAYGTLFDVHSAVARNAAALGQKANPISKLWRQKQLEYSWVRALMDRHTDFWSVTSEALSFALRSFQIEDAALRESLLRSYETLDAYPEVPETLEKLRSHGVQIAILSNGAPAMLASAINAARIDKLVDIVLSVEDIGVYKPAPQVYRHAFDQLALSPDEISFQSSNAWDAAAASANGMHVVWVNRTRQPREYADLPIGYEVDSLIPLPEIVTRAE